MTTDEYASMRLIHLKDSDYEVADGQPDIRGWNVKDINGNTIGEVDDLIFDDRTLKVRYMVVDLDHDYFKLDKDRYVLVPIGAGEVPEKRHEIIISNVTANQFSALPVYDHDRLITPEDEYRVRNIFTGADLNTAGTGVINEDFYNHEYYDQENLHRRRNPMYANRNTADTYPASDTRSTGTVNTTTGPVNTNAPVNTADTTTARDTYTTNTPDVPVADSDRIDKDRTDRDRADRDRNVENTTIPVIEENVQIGKEQVRTGGAYIKARVVEKPIEEKVTLREERLNIERNPVDRPANSTDFDTFKEGVIELEEHAEVPVVNKEARVVEEINISKEVSERTETVRDTVRKTEVDIENLEDRSGNTKNDDVRNR